MIENVVKHYSEAFKTIDDAIARLIDQATINTANRDELLPATLFIKIRNGYVSIINLVHAEMFYESGYILRTIIETLFILKYFNTNKDDAFRRLIEDQKYRDEFLRIMVEYDDAYEYLRERYNAKKTKKKRRNPYKSTSISKWSKLAELTDLYVFAYNVLSSESHTSITSLENNLKIEGNKIIGFKENATTEEVDRLLLTLQEVMRISIQQMAFAFKLDFDEEIQSIDNYGPYYKTKI